MTKFTASLTAEIENSFIARFVFWARAFCARVFFVEAFHANIDGPRPCAEAPFDEILHAGYHLGSSVLRNGHGIPSHMLLMNASH